MAYQNKPSKKILISHASADKDFCDIFVKLLTDMGFSNKTLIYTSKSEYGIPEGKDIYTYLQQSLNTKIWVFFMLYKNYYESAACLNEMGAAWVRNSRYTSILLPGFQHKDIKGAVNPRQITLNLCDPIMITGLRNDFLKAGWKSSMDNLVWESIKNQFVETIKPYYQKT